MALQTLTIKLPSACDHCGARGCSVTVSPYGGEQAYVQCQCGHHFMTPVSVETAEPSAIVPLAEELLKFATGEKNDDPENA